MSQSEVIFSTSFDEKHHPSNIFSSSKNIFWSSTGIYPQELVIVFPQAKPISEMQIVGFNIKHILIEGCENDSAVKYNKFCEKKDISCNDTNLQDITCSFNSSGPCKILKLIILEGYHEFCTVNCVNFK